jgi:hypothetical protein
MGNVLEPVENLEIVTFFGQKKIELWKTNVRWAQPFPRTGCGPLRRRNSNLRLSGEQQSERCVEYSVIVFLNTAQFAVRGQQIEDQIEVNLLLDSP